MAVTVTYTYPVSGTVPPTAAQAAAVNQVNAVVVWGTDADTTATITHDLALAANDPGSLFPLVVINGHSSGMGTAAYTVTVTKTATNAVVLTKAAVAGSTSTLDVAILRPHSIVR